MIVKEALNMSSSSLIRVQVGYFTLSVRKPTPTGHLLNIYTHKFEVTNKANYIQVVPKNFSSPEADPMSDSIIPRLT